MFVKTTVFVTQHPTSIREIEKERVRRSERGCEREKENRESVRMLSYVTLVSLKRVMYSKKKKKKSEGDEVKSASKRRREMVVKDERTAVHRKTYIH